MKIVRSLPSLEIADVSTAVPNAPAADEPAEQRSRVE